MPQLMAPPVANSVKVSLVGTPVILLSLYPQQATVPSSLMAQSWASADERANRLKAPEGKSV